MQWQPYVLEAATLRGVPERDAVDAVALARGHRTVGEAVAQMATAALANNLRRGLGLSLAACATPLPQPQ